MGVTAVCESWILCVGALLASAVRSDFSIRGCEDGSVDVVEGTDPVFTCGDYWISGPQWTVYDNKGQELYTGSCTKWSCTQWNKQFQVYEVEHKQRYMYTSMLTIKNITKDSARKIVCSDFLTRASCDLRIIALYIHDCSSGVRDVTEGTNVSFTCGQYTDQIQWSYLYDHDNGRLNSIGYCNGDGCNSLYASIFFLKEKEVSDKKYESTLYIGNITRHQEFSLRCNEGNITATCRLRVQAPAVLKDCDVSIRDWWVEARCEVEHMYASDGRYSCRWRVNNAQLTSYFQDLLTAYGINTQAYRKGVCYSSHTMPYSPGNYTYSLQINPGVWNIVQTLNIEHPGDPMYTCHANVEEGSTVTCKCTSSKPGNPPAEFSWNRWNTDTLYFFNVQREDSGKKRTCFMTWGPNSYINSQAVLTLTVVVPVSIYPNSCSVQLSGWKVSGVCTVQCLPSIKKRTCIWHLKNEEKTEEIPGVQSIASYKSTDPFEFINCSFVHQMPDINGNYTYSINVSSHPADQFSQSIHIEKPDKPQHNCTKLLLEGSNTTCTCFTLNLGNPPAQIGWAESSNEHFAIEGLTRERNGTVTTCNLTWGGISSTTTYTMNVAFGPSVAYISRSEETFGDETKTVLVCTASDVYPSAFFRWNISCENETHNENTSRCPLSTARVEEQMTIECTASNKLYAEVSSTSIYVLKLTNSSFEWRIIPVSVAAVLVLVVIVAVIVCIKRRKDVNKPKTQTPIERFTAPSGDVYTIAGTTTVDPRDDEYVTVRDTTYRNNIFHTQTPVVRCAAPSGDLYSIAGPATAREVKQEATELNKLETQRPAAHFAAPSGDVYAIAGPTTAGKDKHVTEATNNTSYAPKSRSGYQARDNTHMTNKGTESKKKAVKPKPTRFGKQSSHNLPVTGYVNVPAVPTDSGLGVYHVVPCAAMSTTPGTDARVLDTSKLSEDEYNVLRFQKNQTGQEDHAVTYSHLDFK